MQIIDTKFSITRKNMLLLSFYSLLFLFNYEKGSEESAVKNEQLSLLKSIFGEDSFQKYNSATIENLKGNEQYSVHKIENCEKLIIDSPVKYALNRPYEEAKRIINRFYYPQYFMISTLLPFIIFHYFPVTMLPKYQTLAPTIFCALINTFLLETPFTQKLFKKTQFYGEKKLFNKKGVTTKILDPHNIKIGDELTYAGYISYSENFCNGRETSIFYNGKSNAKFPNDFSVIQYLIFKKQSQGKDVFYYIPCWKANKQYFIENSIMINNIMKNTFYQKELPEDVLYDISKIKTTKQALLYAGIFNFNLMDKYWKNILSIEHVDSAYLNFFLKGFFNIPGRVALKILKILFDK